MRYDDCVGGEDECRFPESSIVDFGCVDMGGLAGGGLKDILEGGEGFGEVFGQGGGDYLEVCKADLGEELFSAWGGGGEDYSFVAERGYDGEFEGERSSQGWWFRGCGLGSCLVGGRGLCWCRNVFCVRHGTQLNGVEAFVDANPMPRASSEHSTVTVKHVTEALNLT